MTEGWAVVIETQDRQPERRLKQRPQAQRIGDAPTAVAHGAGSSGIAAARAGVLPDVMFLQPDTRRAGATDDRSTVNDDRAARDRHIATGLVLLGGSFAAASFLTPNGWSLFFASIGATLLTLFPLRIVLQWIGRWMLQLRVARMGRYLDGDPTPCFVTDRSNALHYMNNAARQQGRWQSARSLSEAVSDIFANPNAILDRLKAQADKVGVAEEEAITRQGYLRLSVHRQPRVGYLWRLEDRGIGPARQRSGAGLPMLTIGRGNTILFMNEAARDFCGARPHALEEVFPDPPTTSGRFAVALSQAGPRNCLAHFVEQSMGRREIYFLPMMDGDGLSQGGVGDGALDLLPLAILRLDGKGRILGANHAAQSLLQIEPDLPCYLGDTLEGPGRDVREWLALALSDSAPTKSEFLRVKGHTDDLFVQVSLCQIEQSEGRRLLAVLSDATMIKSLEDQFAQSQKMQAVGELAGGIAHDFNNLLTAISGHCDLLLRHRVEDDKDFSDLMQIRQNSNRAAALVGQLLAFSRKQTLRPEVMGLRDVLSELAHLLNRLVGERVTLSLKVDPDIHNLRADRRQLEQVMMNLVVNARDAMNGQGQIDINAGNQKVAAPLVRDHVTVPAGDYLVIEVEDGGCGIAPDKLQKVFEPFYTTKGPGKGTGLGLSTVYGIVKQSGGFVFVDSIVGEGTRFTLMFPAAFEAAVTRKTETVSPATSVTGAGTILMVEDEAPVRAFTARALQLSGFKVVEACCGEEALELLSDEALTVDLFLTDVIMPGMDGPTWVREALKTRPGVPVVFVSGYAEDALQDSRHEFAQAQFLPKPFTLDELTETVQNQMR